MAKSEIFVIRPFEGKFSYFCLYNSKVYCLSLSAIDISDWILFLVGDCVLHCRVFSSFPESPLGLPMWC